MVGLRQNSAFTLPKVREDIELLPGPVEEDGSPTWTIHDPVSNAYFRIGWEAYEIISLLSFAKDMNTLIRYVNKNTSLNIIEDDVEEVAVFLNENHLVVNPNDVSVSYLDAADEKKNGRVEIAFLQGLVFFRFHLFNPNNFLNATRWLGRIVCDRQFFNLVFLIFLFGVYLTYKRVDEFFNTFEYLFTWQAFLIYAICISFAKMFHEFGHAFAAKRNGLEVTDIGVGFMLMYPILYTDTSDSWKMQDYKKRRSIGIAGIVAEFYLATICLFLWHIAPDGAFRSVLLALSTVSLGLSLLVNLNPFMRLDGYYLFSDSLGVDNLQSRSFELAKLKMRQVLWGWRFVSPEQFMSLEKQRILIVYAYFTWIYRLLLFSGIALLIYHAVPKPFGLILMIVSLTFFVMIPIVKEFIVWRRGMNLKKVTFQGIWTVTVFLVIAFMFVYPWNNTMTLPAVIHVKDYDLVSVPQSGKIEKVHVQNGDIVQVGDLLVTLASSSLENDLKVQHTELKTIESRLGDIQRDRNLIQEKLVLLEKREKVLRAINGFQDQLNELDIRSKVTGVVRDVSGEVHENRSIEIGSRLMKIVALPSAQNVKCIAYANERQRPRVLKDSYGYFYDDSGGFQRVNIVLSDVSGLSSAELPWPELSSQYGGAIAVDMQQDNYTIAHDPLYTIFFDVDTADDFVNLQQRLRGHVTIKVRAQSYAEKFINATFAVINREVSL